MTSGVESQQTRALLAYFEAHAGLAAMAAKVLAIRSASTDSLRPFERTRTDCLQTNRMQARALEDAGWNIRTELSETCDFGTYDLCVVEATRDKEENLFHVALAWSALAPGGTLVLSAANGLGAESLIRRIREQNLPIRSLQSKAKCRVLAMTREVSSVPAPPAWLSLGQFHSMPGSELVACPGLFSAHAIDAGTRFLCEHLTGALSGRGADFGAGYGAISHHLLSGSKLIRSLDLYEAEWKGLEAARVNLGPWKDAVEIDYRWIDLAAWKPDRRYDWIVMNPPFHTGATTTPSLGQRFISVAAESLVKHGTLWLIANRHLPYERILRERFGSVECRAEGEGYKLCVATGPRSHRPMRGQRSRH